jgi:chromate reductase
MGQPEVFLTVKDGFFDASGAIADAGTRAFLQDWLTKFVAWVSQHQRA